MSKARIIALILEFVVCILPGIVMIWLAIYGWSFSVALVALTVFFFGVGSMAMVVTAKDMD